MGISGISKVAFIGERSSGERKTFLYIQVCRGLRGSNAALEGKLEDIFKSRGLSMLNDGSHEVE